ncbi:MAG: hypothetical protein WCI27_10675 [Candidatus Omnitrophota bacterium]
MEYKSKIAFCGLPLIDIATGKPEAIPYTRGIAKGWIAIGDISFGVLFSIGGMAFGGIAIGGISLGVVSLAGAAVGVFALGGLAIGVYAVGGAAIAVYSAVGGFAAACTYAVGGVALAGQANSGLAKIAMKNSYFFRMGDLIFSYGKWFLILWIIPLIFQIRKNSKTVPRK